MQLQKVSLDGTASGPVSTIQQGTTKNYISEAINASRENDGYLIICGEALDSEAPSERIVNIVAISGQLQFVNLVP